MTPDEMDQPRAPAAVRMPQRAATARSAASGPIVPGLSALLVLLGLTGCTSPARQADADQGTGPSAAGPPPAASYAANVRSHVEAMEAGMERARRDLALRALWRRIEDPS